MCVHGHPIPLLAINTFENRITCHTLHQMIHGHFGDHVQRFVMLDTRYTYEFEGGSVKGSRHLQDPNEAEALMPGYVEDDTVVVVFCEFSQHRGPRMYRLWLRMSRLWKDLGVLRVVSESRVENAQSPFMRVRQCKACALLAAVDKL